jgi:aminopeptidase-like protein
MITSANRRELNLGRHICGPSIAQNNNTGLCLLLIMLPDLGAVKMSPINCAPYSIGRAGCPEWDFGPFFNVS